MLDLPFVLGAKVRPSRPSRLSPAQLRQPARDHANTTPVCRLSALLRQPKPATPSGGRLLREHPARLGG